MPAAPRRGRARVGRGRLLLPGGSRSPRERDQPPRPRDVADDRPPRQPSDRRAELHALGRRAAQVQGRVAVKPETTETRGPRPQLDPRFDPDRGEHPGAYPGAPVWEPGEGLDAFFPDHSASTGDDDEEEA